MLLSRLSLIIIGYAMSGEAFVSGLERGAFPFGVVSDLDRLLNAAIITGVFLLVLRVESPRDDRYPVIDLLIFLLDEVLGVL